MNVYNIFQPRDGHLKEFLCLEREAVGTTSREVVEEWETRPIRRCLQRDPKMLYKVVNLQTGGTVYFAIGAAV